MTGLRFACTGSRPEPWAAGPSLQLDLRVDDGTGRRVHAVALRVQIRIDPRGRRYSAAEKARLSDLFGDAHRWGGTLTPLQLATVPVMVPSFTGSTTVPVNVPLSYDLEVAAGRYLHGLDGGSADAPGADAPGADAGSASAPPGVPLVLLFSGTLFYAGDTGVQVGLVSWQEEAHHALPVAVWRAAMDEHFPDQGWLRLRRDTLDRLADYRSAYAVSWDDAVDRLLKEQEGAGARGPAMDDFDEIAAVADAVLFEGYLLYPYRASAQKNRVRWQWGVLMPAGAGSGETSSQRVECLVEPRRPDARLAVRVRFLHLEQRSLTDTAGREVETLDVGGTRHLAFDEGVPEQVDATLGFDAVGSEALRSGTTVPIAVPGSRTVEELTHPDGSAAGRVVRTRAPLSGTVSLRASEVPGPFDVLRLELTVRNDAVAAPGASRDAALRTALIGTHTMLAVSPGAFLSSTDPPEWAAALVAECAHEHAWPVLAGPPERSDLLLCTPIILSDHPQLAPESSVNLFDGTENDEILTLRTMVLTEAEKAEARATDPRAAAIVDAVDALPPEMLERLHGAIRSLDPPHAAGDGVPTLVTPDSGSAGSPVGADSPAAAPPASVPWWDPGADSAVDPETDAVVVGGVEVARGSAVVLRPGLGTERSAGGTSTGTDAQDTFLAGMRATVQAVVHDVDGGVHVAVSVDDDPAAELQLAHGRFRYFRPDELEPAR